MSKRNNKIIIKLEFKFKIHPLCCSICGQPLLPEQRISLDHYIPKCHGGTNDASNIQLAHQICNSIKNDLMPEDFNRLKYHLYQNALKNWHIKNKDKLIIINALKHMR